MRTCRHHQHQHFLPRSVAPAAWNSKSLYLGPFLVSLLGALQGNDVRVLRSGIIQPVQRVAYILSVAVACAFLTTELFKGFVMC